MCYASGQEKWKSSYVELITSFDVRVTTTFSSARNGNTLETLNSWWVFFGLISLVVFVVLLTQSKKIKAAFGRRGCYFNGTFCWNRYKQFRPAAGSPTVAFSPLWGPKSSLSDEDHSLEHPDQFV